MAGYNGTRATVFMEPGLWGPIFVKKTLRGVGSPGQLIAHTQIALESHSIPNPLKPKPSRIPERPDLSNPP